MINSSSVVSDVGSKGYCRSREKSFSLKILGRRPIHMSNKTGLSTSGEQSNCDSVHHCEVKKRKLKKSSKNRFSNVSPPKKTRDSDGDEVEKTTFVSKPISSKELKTFRRNSNDKSLPTITSMSKVSVSTKASNSKEDPCHHKSNVVDSSWCNNTLFNDNKDCVFKNPAGGVVSISGEKNSLSSTIIHTTPVKCSTVSPSNESESTFMKTFKFLRDKMKNASSSQSEDNQMDEDLIVVSKVDENVVFSYWDIKRVVKNIVNNIMVNNPQSVGHLTACEVAQRMKSLYHQDFTNRLKEISQCLHIAKSKCEKLSNLVKEVRPGLRQSDLETLNPEEWLNDVIINKYFELLVRDVPSACCVSSFFYEELHRNVGSSLPLDWHKKEYLLVPVCLESHWSMLCVRPQKQTVEVYNSMRMGGAEEECSCIVLSFLEHEYNQVIKLNSAWSAELVVGLPRQQNEYDCGVYACMFARATLFHLSLRIDPSNVTSFRNWIKLELMENCIRS